MKNRKRFLKYKRNLRKWQKHGMWLEMKCPFCGEVDLFLYDKYDAECCVSCDVWISKACGDPNCPFCAGRPSVPSEALFLEDERDIFRKDRLRKNYQHKNDGKLRHARREELYDEINERE